jgi:single-strand DNA-binding protein
LVSDPVGKELPEGYVCELRIAVDGMGHGGRDQAGYIDVHSYGESARAARDVLSKGWLIAVDGRLEYNTWEKDGQRRHDYRVVGHVEFLAAPKNDHASNGDGGGAPAEEREEAPF